MSRFELEALWLQTHEKVDWIPEHYDKVIKIYTDDIADFIFGMLIKEAADFRSKGVDNYFGF